MKQKSIQLISLIIALAVMLIYSLYLLNALQDSTLTLIYENIADQKVESIAEIIDSMHSLEGETSVNLLINEGPGPDFTLTFSEGGGIALDYKEPYEGIQGVAVFGVQPRLVKGGEISCGVDRGANLIATKKTIKEENEYVSNISIDFCGMKMVFEDRYTQQSWNQKVGDTYGVYVKEKDLLEL